MCLTIVLFGFILYQTLWASWTWVAILFPMLEKFSAITPQIFSHTPSFSFPLALTLSQRCPDVCKCVMLESPQHNNLLPLWLAYSFSWTPSAVLY